MGTPNDSATTGWMDFTGDNASMLNSSDYDFPLEHFDVFEVLDNSKYFKATGILMLYISPILIILGTIGNLLVVVVLQSTLFKKTTCSFLLSALAVVDTGVLNTVLLRLWIQELTVPSRFDVRSISDAGCKLHAFFTYFFPQLSSWTLVLVTIDRVVSVGKPLTAREICTKQRMMVLWVIVCLILAGVNCRVFFHYTLVIHELPGGMTRAVCRTHTESTEKFRDIHSWIDFTFLCLVPMKIIISSNTFIMVMMLRAKMRRKMSLNARPRPSCRGQSSRSANRLSTATVMLVTLSVVFVITTIPRCVYFLGLPWPQREMMEDQRGSLEDHIWVNFFYKTCLLVYCTSNAVNFLLYCVSGSRFRQAIMNILSGKDFPFLRREFSRGGSFFSSRNTRTSLVSSGGSKKRKTSVPTQNSTISSEGCVNGNMNNSRKDFIPLKEAPGQTWGDAHL